MLKTFTNGFLNFQRQNKSILLKNNNNNNGSNLNKTNKSISTTTTKTSKKRLNSTFKSINDSGSITSLDGNLISFENGFNFNGRSFIFNRNFIQQRTRQIHTSKELNVDNKNNNNTNNNNNNNNKNQENNDVNKNNKENNNNDNSTTTTTTTNSGEKKIDPLELHQNDPNLLKETMKPVLNWDEYFESMRQQQEHQRDRMKELPHRPWEDNRIWSSILRWWSNRFPKTKARKAAAKEEELEAKAKGEEFIPKFDDEPSWVHQWRQQSGKWWR